MTQTHDTYVRAIIDPATKALATEALNAMGLFVSDAIRPLMLRVADEKRLPFEVKVPNKKTLAAMAEFKAGGGKSFDSTEQPQGRRAAWIFARARPRRTGPGWRRPPGGRQRSCGRNPNGPRP